MIRKAIIVVLTLGAVSVTAISLLSYSAPIHYEKFWLTDKDNVLFRCDAGHIKLLWIQADEGGRSLHIDDRRLYLNPNRMVILDRIEPRYIPRVRWRTKLPTQPSSCRRTQIQVWAWLVVAGFAAYPTISFIRGPLRRWRRRRKGLCVKCRYDLTGNESGVCPECGDAI